MRFVLIAFLSMSVASCGGLSPLSYVTTGLQFASNPAELAANYYEKIQEDRRLALERRNRLKLKAELDLQECGAVYVWLERYYKRHGGGHFAGLETMQEKYIATGIDRSFLKRVIHSRLGDGKRKLAIENLPDLHWIMHNKRLCDEVYFDRVVSNDQFRRPLKEPALYEARGL